MSQSGEHGTRATYQAGCHCTPCRAANAQYQANLRRRHLTGQPILGAHVSASIVWRRVRSLGIEGFSHAEIARRLGYRQPELQWGETVMLRTAQRIDRFYQTVMHA